jgi:hypothetical protein
MPVNQKGWRGETIESVLWFWCFFAGRVGSKKEMDISPPQLVLRSMNSETCFMSLFFWAYYKYNFLTFFGCVDGLFLKVLKA